MPRAVAIIAACLCFVFAMRVASADAVDTSVRQLGNAKTSYKVRLAAALSLSKSKDARAVIALARALREDSEATIRRVSALALEKMIDSRTAEDARELGLDALAAAAKGDTDKKVRDTADKANKSLAALRKTKKKSKGTSSNGVAVFVNIDKPVDQTKKLDTANSGRVMSIVKKNVDGTGYSTSWPSGGLPSESDLDSNSTRGFIVASTVKKIDISKVNGGTQIACTLAVRIAPWAGKDGGEKWEANKAASASGSAKAMTGNRDKDVAGGIRDCLEAVAEDITSRQVVPFLKRVASAGS
jgi:hypothetical protein